MNIKIEKGLRECLLFCSGLFSGAGCGLLTQSPVLAFALCSIGMFQFFFIHTATDAAP